MNWVTTQIYLCKKSVLIIESKTLIEEFDHGSD